MDRETLRSLFKSAMEALKANGHILATVAALSLLLQHYLRKPKALITDLNRVGYSTENPAALSFETEFDVIIVGGGQLLMLFLRARFMFQLL